MSKQEIIRKKWFEVLEKAEKIDDWYVMCVFISPITHTIEFRVGYFEERHDAEQWISTLTKRYNELNVPYYIRSNTTDYTIGDVNAFMD